MLATWAARIPALRDRFDLSEGVLGGVLLAVAAGSVLAFVLSGGLIARFGSARVSAGSTVAFCLALAAVMAAPTLPLLVALLLFFGACIGTMDVAMNAQAVLVEERAGRPLMSTFHALFSLGALVGAALAAVVIGHEVPPEAHSLATAGACLAAALVAFPRLLPDHPTEPTDAPLVALPHPAVWNLGVLAFLGLLAEGAMGDWSALYLRLSLFADEARAVWGFAAFSLTMAVGRFAGDALRARFDAEGLVRASSALAFLGMLLVLAGGVPVALVGFGLVGLGLSNTVPVLFSAAGRIGGLGPGVGIAGVATAGYFGLLVGPPLIGFLADLTSLRAAMGAVAAALLAMALMAGQIGRSAARSSAEGKASAR